MLFFDNPTSYFCDIYYKVYSEDTKSNLQAFYSENKSSRHNYVSFWQSFNTT